MAIDWGLSTALLGRDDFAQRRADATYSLQLQQHMADQAAQDYAQEQAAQQGLLDAFNKPSQMDVLPGDRQRIIDFEKQQRAPIEDALYNANGDTDQFYANGGKGLLNQYQQGLLNAKDARGINPIAAALANKHTNAMWENARENGLDINPNDAQGNAIPDIQQQIAEHNAGKRDLLQFGGSAKKVDYLPGLQFITSQPPPNGDVYTPQPISMGTLKSVIAAHGGNKWQQDAAVKQFADSKNPNISTLNYKYIKPEKPHYYGLMDQAKYQHYLDTGEILGSKGTGGNKSGVEGVADNFIDKVNLTLNNSPKAGWQPLKGHEDTMVYHTNFLNGTPVEVTNPLNGQKTTTNVVDVTYSKLYPDKKQVWYVTEDDKGTPVKHSFVVDKNNAWPSLVEPFSRNAKYGTKFGDALIDAATQKGIIQGTGAEKWELGANQTSTAPAQPSSSSGQSKIPGF